MMNDLFEMIAPYFKQWMRDVLLEEREKRQAQPKQSATPATEK